MNLPNAITLSRIPAMFVIAALMFATWPGAATAAFWLFILAAVGDWLDGHIARTRGLVSNFGKLMDAMADKIMVMGIVVALVEKHQINLMLALVVLCREFLVTGMRMVAATKGVVVAADSGGKTKTLTLLISIGFYLGAPMLLLDGSTFFHWDASRAAGYILTTGGVFFIAGTLLSVWSGTRYFVRNAKVVFAEEAALP